MIDCVTHVTGRVLLSVSAAIFQTGMFQGYLIGNILKKHLKPL